MIIADLDIIHFSIDADEETATIDFIDPDTSASIGLLQIKHSKGQAFVQALTTILREAYNKHGEFEINDKATTRLENDNTGVLNFREE